MIFKERITVCDVLDAGACLDGVLPLVMRFGLEANVAELRAAVARSEVEYVDKAARANGYGSGDGYGYGYGSGYGYGDGDGDGYGYGYGYGDGRLFNAT